MINIKDSNETKVSTEEKNRHIQDRKYFDNSIKAINAMKTAHIPKDNLFK